MCPAAGGNGLEALLDRLGVLGSKPFGMRRTAIHGRVDGGPLVGENLEQGDHDEVFRAGKNGVLNNIGRFVPASGCLCASDFDAIVTNHPAMHVLTPVKVRAARAAILVVWLARRHHLYDEARRCQ